jgi:RNA polymerase sigma-70 factor (ECF subfamily)
MTPTTAPKPPDDELAACATPEALAELDNRHAPDLLAFLAARTPSNYEDIHQDVWLRAWEHLPGGFRGGNFRAWLFEIARNRVTDYERRKRPGRLGEETDPADHRSDINPVATAQDRERREQLKKCLQRLEQRDARAAVLVRGRLGGEAYTDLCTQLGLTMAKAHKLWHTAVRGLQTCVERDRR